MPFDFAAAYDEVNPADDDYRYYVELATQLGARRAVDLGCGTGVLAVLLANAGLEVVGIDPDTDMLDIARARPGAERVTWRQGYADSVESGWADIAVMSGHVAQVFVADAEWHGVLAELRRGLRGGGTLAFETRNPAARGWEGWTREQTSLVLDDARDHELWHETVAVDLPRVTYATFVRDLGTGEQTREQETLAFRDEATVRADVERVGFVVERLHGDWDGSPVTSDSPELIVVATRPRGVPPTRIAEHPRRTTTQQTDSQRPGPSQLVLSASGYPISGVPVTDHPTDDTTRPSTTEDNGDSHTDDTTAEGRSPRWRSRRARLGGAAFALLLVGGLGGWGVAAATSDDGHDHGADSGDHHGRGFEPGHGPGDQHGSWGPGQGRPGS